MTLCCKHNSLNTLLRFLYILMTDQKQKVITLWNNTQQISLDIEITANIIYNFDNLHCLPQLVV